MKEEKAIHLVKPMLGKKRWEHTLNVRDMAVKLAKIHGEDPEKAALAAILHDCAKELPKEEMLQIFRENGTMAGNVEERPQPVWHGVCAAIIAQVRWGVEDEEVLSAIRCHTTGRPGMTRLDKIIFLADMTSKERDFPGVEKLRKLAKKNLDQAMCRALESTLAFVKEKKQTADPMSAAALEDLLGNCPDKEEDQDERTPQD